MRHVGYKHNAEEIGLLGENLAATKTFWELSIFTEFLSKNVLN